MSKIDEIEEKDGKEKRRQTKECQKYENIVRRKTEFLLALNVKKDAVEKRTAGYTASCPRRQYP
jgi:hypothetical protein